MAMEPMYRCSACALGVIAIKKGEGEGDEVTFIRGCRCEGAAIIGRMQATVVARGGTMSDGPARKPVLSGGATAPADSEPAGG